MKTRTPEEMAQYQKDRRAKVAGLRAEIVKMEEPAKKVILPAAGKEVVRLYVPPEGTHSNYQYLPGDHVIGNMTQHQRDLILAKMPKTNARER